MASKQIRIYEISFLHSAWQNFEAMHESYGELLPDDELEQMLAHHGEMYGHFVLTSEVGYTFMNNMEL